MNPQLIYFAERDGLIKIGISRAPYSRTAQLRARLIATMPGGHSDETALHHMLAEHRVGVEWFRPHGDVQAVVDEALAGRGSDLIVRARASVVDRNIPRRRSRRHRSPGSQPRPAAPRGRRPKLHANLLVDARCLRHAGHTYSEISAWFASQGVDVTTETVRRSLLEAVAS